MWQDMEEARKATLQAQNLSAMCQQLCTQSDEDNVRMRSDIRQSLETRIKDEEFWIGELESRLATIKRHLDDLKVLGDRLHRGIANCDRNLAITRQCLAYRSETCGRQEHGTKLLMEEMAMLENGSACIGEMIEAVRRRWKATADTCAVLENGLKNKYEALQKDRQSMGLKLHSLQMSLELVGGSMRSRDAAVALHSTQRNWKEASNTNVKLADEQIATTRMLLEKVDVVLSDLGSALAAEFRKVTDALQDRCNVLRQEKCDLEHHLAMLEFQMGQTEESCVLLQKAMDDKKRAVSVTEEQLRLHNARPQSELSADEVQVVLTKELLEARRDLNSLMAQFPQLEKTLRSLRRSKLDVANGIEQKMRGIELEESKCLSIRAAMDTIKL